VFIAYWFYFAAVRALLLFVDEASQLTRFPGFHAHLRRSDGVLRQPGYDRRTDYHDAIYESARRHLTDWFNNHIIQYFGKISYICTWFTCGITVVLRLGYKVTGEHSTALLWYSLPAFKRRDCADSAHGGGAPACD
jgi:hypothetical protein